MSKQTFRLRNNLILNILFSFSSVALTLFGLLAAFPAVSESTHAEGDTPNEGIAITISPEINASLISSENGDYKIVKDTVTIGTDALNGYTLYISTDTSEHQTLYLNGDKTSENRINGTSGTYELPTTLGAYEWGFAVPGVGHFDSSYSEENPNENSKFAVLPTENKIIRDYTTSTTEDAAEVYYGFKLGGTIEPGAYETNITYTAIPATQPLKAKAVLGDNGNLNFLYDRKTYTVGEAYVDNIGETEISAIYDVPISSSSSNKPEWTNNNNILTVNFDTYFYNFKPISTSYWFYKDLYLGSVTGTTNLNTSSVTNMSNMFQMAGESVVPAFSLELGGWDTSSVTNMSNMFENAGNKAATFHLGLNGWDISNVTNIRKMFHEMGSMATVLDLNFSGWKVSDTTVIRNSEFLGVGFLSNTSPISVNINLSDWDTSSITDMSFLFNFDLAVPYATTLKLNLSGWDTSNVASMEGMFAEFCAGSVPGTFYLDLSGWDTSNVTNMRGMFYEAGHRANDWSIVGISGWDTGNVTDMSRMFDGAGHDATTWSVGDISGWDTGNVMSMNRMFFASGYYAPAWDIGNLNYVDDEHQGWDISKVADHYLFIDWDRPNINLNRLPWQSN